MINIMICSIMMFLLKDKSTSDQGHGLFSIFFLYDRLDGQYRKLQYHYNNSFCRCNILFFIFFPLMLLLKIVQFWICLSITFYISAFGFHGNHKRIFSFCARWPIYILFFDFQLKTGVIYFGDIRSFNHYFILKNKSGN